MVLDCARWRPTYVHTVTNLRFGMHSIHRKRLANWSFSRLCQELQSTCTQWISALFWPWIPRNTNHTSSIHYSYRKAAFVNLFVWYFRIGMSRKWRIIYVFPLLRIMTCAFLSIEAKRNRRISEFFCVILRNENVFRGGSIDTTSILDLIRV